MRPTMFATVTLAATLAAGSADAAWERGFGLAVVVDGAERTEYHGRGQTYVEALRGKEYVLRISNPLPVRVAVALSVDGLSTIDARHGDAWSASKWVLDPYETIEISGWQVSGSEARRFYFTGEKHSYGAWLGQTDNLGVIEAVFFKEAEPVWRLSAPGISRRDTDRSGAAAGPPAPQASAQASKSARPELADEYAATGIGDRTPHEVQRVHLELERAPVATVRIRYEFRPQLVKLGLIPRWPTPLERRERARGFADGFCPDPGR